MKHVKTYLSFLNENNNGSLENNYIGNNHVDDILYEIAGHIDNIISKNHFTEDEVKPMNYRYALRHSGFEKTCFSLFKCFTDYA